MLKAARAYAVTNSCDVFINCDANCVVHGSKSFPVKDQDDVEILPLPYLRVGGPRLPELQGVSIEFNCAAPKTRGKSPLENQQFIAKGGHQVECATMITAIARHNSSAETSVVALPAQKLLGAGNTTDHTINFNAASGCPNLNLGFMNYKSNERRSSSSVSGSRSQKTLLESARVRGTSCRITLWPALSGLLQSWLRSSRIPGTTSEVHRKPTKGLEDAPLRGRSLETPAEGGLRGS